MTNMCSNELHITSSIEDSEYIKKYIEKTFPNDELILEEPNYNLVDLELSFDSKGSFPLEEMITLFDNLKDQENFEATCLSVEWGERYAEFWECNNYGWTLV